MIKLFIQNKFIEIANFIYRLWNEDTPSRYFVIWLMTMIPGAIAVYNCLMIFDPKAINVSSLTVLFVGWAYFSLALFVIGMLHLITHITCKWIRSNIELAKKGIKVKAAWKD